MCAYINPKKICLKMPMYFMNLLKHTSSQDLLRCFVFVSINVLCNDNHFFRLIFSSEKKIMLFPPSSFLHLLSAFIYKSRTRKWAKLRKKQKLRMNFFSTKKLQNNSTHEDWNFLLSIVTHTDMVQIFFLQNERNVFCLLKAPYFYFSFPIIKKYISNGYRKMCAQN